MKILLDDGATFEIDEIETSTVVIDKFVRIMKYMAFADVAIANGLAQSLFELRSNPEVKPVIRELCEES